ncbi:GRIP and coiled-coil domain-containing protein 1 [Cryptotermes secundus]|uniref:GRIP and coiled-coil domain-containing protein 1 n=2 Tax=Cryptotermes secundus TaxID=105785 RepID=A0A2J7QT75_9NEOP|nr:GRIP and coiled-coil domain-containing protein 1 [Cryptotermes secundus]
MEHASKRELLVIVNKQKDQLIRYESRLRDVVTAYKGLIKEKEALEASLKALTVSSTSDKSTRAENKTSSNETEKEETTANSAFTSEVEVSPKEETNQSEETVEHLHSQLATLMNSLATLSAEKSRMEASFQADKKQLRFEKEEHEKVIKELQEKYQQSLRLHQSEVEILRSKLTTERHEREKEQNDHGVMIRELQKLLAEERRLKDQQENQTEELRTKFTQLESQSGQKEQYEKKLRDLRNELEATRRKLKRAEAKAKETPPLLLELQDEMANMKLQHQAAIFEEQKRAADAEERARRLATVHEERVANLEARLAELSETVGNYDRLRQQDQMAIQKLKEHIAQVDIEHSTLSRITPNMSVIDSEAELKGKSEADLCLDVQTLVDKILYLRGQLVLASQRAEKPVDIHDILNINDSLGFKNNDEHKSCQEEYQQLKHEFEQYKQSQLQQPNNLRMEESSVVSSLQTQVKTLKDRVRILNSQLEDTDAEWKQKVDDLQQLLKAEKMKCKEELAATEMDYRGRLSLLEQQLQKQRERSLSLLEEKEQEIQTLKSTFQMFLPGNMKRGSPAELLETKETGSGSGNVIDSLTQFNEVIRGLGPTGGGENPHMLHYAHELARRNVEISNLRKAKHQLESAFRQFQRAATIEEEKHQEETNELKEEVARLVKPYNSKNNVLYTITLEPFKERT